MKKWIWRILLIAFFIAIMLLSGQRTNAAEKPSCNYIQVLSAASPLYIAPRINNATRDTIADVWIYYQKDIYPTSELGWWKLYGGLKVGGGPLLYWDSPVWEEKHVLALQVYEFGNLVDSWLWNPNCMVMIGD